MPRQGIMLAYPFDLKRLERWEPPWLLQPKLDGDRAKCAVGQVPITTLISSEQNIIGSVPVIIQELSDAFKDYSPLVLDGELYVSGLKHQEIHGMVSRKVNLHPNHEMIEYHIFDIALESPELPQVARAAAVEEVVAPLVRGLDHIKIVPNTWVDSIEIIAEKLEEYLEQGYEGFVIRNKRGIYTFKRSLDMMKFKPHEEDSYKIVDTAEEVSIYGEPKGCLGAFVCFKDGKPFGVGTGPALTRQARQELWLDRASLKGRFLRVKYQTLTKDSIPRFPVAMEIIESLAVE